ncbi:MAG: protoglobin domain-containing protein [Bryobacteraceae bacterium]|nr:protoglobin domain-containing protein [Bryobacteraceae bacterium]
MTQSAIPGYSYGSPALARSPVTLEELELLKKTVLFTAEDEAALRRSKSVLEPQVEQILDVWYGFVGSHPHLVSAFCDPATGQPDAHYLEAVRKRFGRWILDTAEARYDQAWLDYQHEIGLRHHRRGKNRTDGARASDHVPFRYLIALLYPVTATLRPFLERGGAAAEEVDRMHQAWIKSVLMQVILWSWPYVKEGDF